MHKEEVTAIAPGRINIIGEHTDYNYGWVMPAAIQKHTRITMNRIPGNICKVEALDLKDSFEFDIRDFSRIDHGWQNYVLGVVGEIMADGGTPGAFTCTIQSEVPVGGGMSSSAALECSIAVALNELFTLNIEKQRLIQACHRAEHNWVGIKSGIMDQFASMMGKRDHALLLDCKTLDYEYLPLQLEGYDILVLNTNVAHELASSEYNKRRNECEEGVYILKKYYPEIESLRDVQMDILLKHQSEIPPLIYSRCFHVIRENNRVHQATYAMRQNDIAGLGALLYESHYSLRDHYQVSCAELDFLVEHSKSEPAIAGSRMMGGGFGGSTISIIQSERTPAYIEKISSLYHESFGLELTSTIVATDDGARIV
jgi:galactokinase